MTGIGAAGPRLQPWVKAPPGAGASGVLVAPGCDDVVVGYRSVNKTVYSAKYHLEIPPPVALFRLVHLAQGCSFRLGRLEFPQLRRLRCLWGPWWFVSTVGGAPPEVVRGYVENQEQVA